MPIPAQRSSDRLRLTRSCSRSLAALSDHALSDILEDRIREDRKLGRPFEAASSYVPTGPARKAFKHLEIMENLTDQLVADFGMVDEQGKRIITDPWSDLKKLQLTHGDRAPLGNAARGARLG